LKIPGADAVRNQIAKVYASEKETIKNLIQVSRLLYIKHSKHLYASYNLSNTFILHHVVYIFT
jgi:hypothetical protein